MTQPFFIIFFPITTQSSSQRSWKEKLLIRYTIILNAAQVEWRNPLPSTCHSDDHREKESHAKCYSPLLVWCHSEVWSTEESLTKREYKTFGAWFPSDPDLHTTLLNPNPIISSIAFSFLHSKGTELLFLRQYRNIGI